MTAFDQLAAVETLLKSLLAESDQEVLRARLREGACAGVEEHRPDFPCEEFAIGMALNVSILARQLYDQARAQFGLPPGSRVVVGQGVISTARGLAEPPARDS